MPAASYGPLACHARRRRVTLLALTPAPDAESLDSVSLCADEKAAVLLGSVGPGLTNFGAGCRDPAGAYPDDRRLDSLKIAIAITCYAFGRR